MDLNEYYRHFRRKILVYGEPKSGKTVLVGQLARLGYQLHFISMDEGIKSLIVDSNLPKEFWSNIHVVRIPDHRLNPVAITACVDIMKGGNKKFCYSHGIQGCPKCRSNKDASWSHEFNILEFTDKDILVFDHLGIIGDSALNKAMLSLNSAISSTGDDNKPEWDDWQKQGAKLNNFLSRVQVADINIIAISHDLDVEKPESSRENFYPKAGTRNFSRGVAGYFDDIVYCKTVGGKFGVYSKSAQFPNVLTGTRSNLDISKSPEKLALFFRKHEDLPAGVMQMSEDDQKAVDATKGA